MMNLINLCQPYKNEMMFRVKPYQAVVVLLKSSRSYQKVFFFLAILVYKQSIQQQNQLMSTLSPRGRINTIKIISKSILLFGNLEICQWL